jgi:hypothetical protein
MMHEPSETTARAPHARPATAVEYRPGVCNIGPAEIARRRRAGHVGTVTTLVLWAMLAARGSPPRTRLLVALPASAAATGYLQARLRFCAGFGALGVFNFGPLGKTHAIADPEARERDRRMAMRIGLASLAIGLAVGIAAARSGR